MASRALADGEQPILERLKDRFLFPDISGVVRGGSSTGMLCLSWKIYVEPYARA